MCICTCIKTGAAWSVHLHVYACVCMCMHVSGCVHVYACVCICLDIVLSYIHDNVLLRQNGEVLFHSASARTYVSVCARACIHV